MKQAIAHQEGNAKGIKTHVPSEVDVQAIRKRIGLSQQEFAAKFSISLGTLRHWERGDRKPHGPALVLVLLRVIDKEGRAVKADRRYLRRAELRRVKGGGVGR